MRYDDSDMKIVGTAPAEPAKKQDETSETARLLSREKENGNLNRARRLGALLADEVAAAKGDRRSDAHAGQRRILLAFASEVSLEGLLPNTLLAQTALSVFNDTLRSTAPEFYEDLQESGAFSFYYLCIRDSAAKKSRLSWDDEAVAVRVGDTFATLCGRKEDPALCEEGAALYRQFISLTKSFCDGMSFVTETAADPL